MLARKPANKTVTNKVQVFFLYTDILMLVGAPDLGCSSNVASARALLTAENADVAASVHARSLREDLDRRRFSI